MTRTIKHRGKQIEATEDTPLTIKAIAAFFGWGRQTVYDDKNRGYKFEYGTMTTPKHYRAWLRENPRPARSAKAQADASKLAHEQSRLN